MIIKGYEHFGGKHGETGGLKNILTYLGVTSPHTGEPFTEEMLLGIGGGIGAAYFVYEFKHRPFLILGGRNSWEGSRVFAQGICQRLGIPAIIRETGSKKAAESNLKEALEDAHPAIAWVDLASMPYLFLPADLVKYFSHSVVVCGYDEQDDQYLVDDRAITPLHVPARVIEAARAAITSNKNAIMIIEAPSKLANLKQAVKEGIKICWQEMLAPRIKNFGLTSLTKWADLVANKKDQKGWPKVFKPGLHLFQALMAVYERIETGGTGGSAYRLMYSRFLDEASDVLGDPALKENAEQYRDAARLWSRLAVAALPDSVKLLKEARKLADQKKQLFECEGEPALPKIQRINEQLQKIESRVSESFPLEGDEVQDFLENLRGKILQVYEAEEKAINAIKSRF